MRASPKTQHPAFTGGAFYVVSARDGVPGRSDRHRQKEKASCEQRRRRNDVGRIIVDWTVTAQLTPRVCRSAHRSIRRITPPQATTSSGASIVSMTLLPSRRHSIAQMMHRTITRTHQSLRTRSSSLSSGSIRGPVKVPRRSGVVRDTGSDRSAAPELADHRRREPRGIRGPMTRPFASVTWAQRRQTRGGASLGAPAPEVDRAPPFCFRTLAVGASYGRRGAIKRPVDGRTPKPNFSLGRWSRGIAHSGARSGARRRNPQRSCYGARAHGCVGRRCRADRPLGSVASVAPGAAR
jgi:hypothetical protein